MGDESKWPIFVRQETNGSKPPFNESCSILTTRSTASEIDIACAEEPHFFHHVVPERQRPDGSLNTPDWCMLLPLVCAEKTQHPEMITSVPKVCHFTAVAIRRQAMWDHTFCVRMSPHSR